MQISMFEVAMAAIFVGVPLWGAVDAARMKSDSWERAGRNKTTWVVLLLACAVFWGIGLLGTLLYFRTARKEVAAFERDPNRPTQSPT